tara:strand:+ start:451 stop:864 length:414 start_codon:yes stop_codon:yes gene_type:complete
MYEYKIEVLKVIDGDTVDVDIDLGFGVWIRNERVRLFGIDTPESRTRDLEEKKYGLAAKQYLKQLIHEGSDLKLKTYKDQKGKFGRVLGELLAVHPKEGFININDKLVYTHHAVAYHGQSKEKIAEQHIANREHVVL